MQHHQSGDDGGDIHRHHYRGIFRESQFEEISRNDIDQVRYDKRQAGGIGNKPCGHHESKCGAFTEAKRQEHSDNNRRQNKCRAIVGKQCRDCRAEQNDIRKQKAATTVPPARNVQRCPFEKA